jgi:hypothetical protein
MHIARTGTPQQSICSGAAQVSRLCSLRTPSPERKQYGGVRVFWGRARERGGEAKRGSGKARRGKAGEGRGKEGMGGGREERASARRKGTVEQFTMYRPVKNLYRNFVHELARLRLPLWLAKILVNLHTHTHTHMLRAPTVCCLLHCIRLKATCQEVHFLCAIGACWRCVPARIFTSESSTLNNVPVGVP